MFQWAAPSAARGVPLSLCGLRKPCKAQSRTRVSSKVFCLVLGQPHSTFCWRLPCLFSSTSKSVSIPRELASSCHNLSSVSPAFSQLRLPHPVLFYRTQKIGKIDELPSTCQNVFILWPKEGKFYELRHVFTMDRTPRYKSYPRDSSRCRVGEPPVRGPANFAR